LQSIKNIYKLFHSSIEIQICFNNLESKAIHISLFQCVFGIVKSKSHFDINRCFHQENGHLNQNFVNFFIKFE